MQSLPCEYDNQPTNFISLNFAPLSIEVSVLDDRVVLVNNFIRAYSEQYVSDKE
jgi:hypothetical protein